MKGIITILLLVLAFGAGIYASQRIFGSRNKPTESASVLLEHIQEVAKLVTVEGQFSEVYNYSEYQGYFTLLFDKKVLVRVRATVAAGYDLNQLSIEADSTAKRLRIGPIPEPQILSIDHTIDYYDIRQGFFTSFTPEDYNRVNARAKDLIRDQAMQSSLLPSARAQGIKMIDLMRFMAEQAGWTVEIVGPTPPSQ
jgi:hypothetical protein